MSDIIFSPEEETKFREGDYLLMRPDIGYQHLPDNTTLTTVDFTRLKNASMIKVLKGSTEDTLLVRCYIYDTTAFTILIDIETARNILRVDREAASFNVGDYVIFNSRYSDGTMAEFSSLPISKIIEMKESPMPYKIVEINPMQLDRVRVEYIIRKDKSKQEYWIWRCCLKRFVDLDIVDSECEASECDICSLL